MNYKNILRIVIISIIVKVLYIAFSIFAQGDSSALSMRGYCNTINRNDTGWYEKIASNWYPTITDKKDLGYNNGPEFKQSEWAFFPLYPGLIRITMKWLNIDFSLSALIWSLILSTLAFIGFYLFCEIYLNDSKKAFYCSLVFLLFPFHYYYSMMYTEALFFTLLIFSFISIHYQRSLALSVLIIPLVLVRPNGIFALIPLYLYFLERNSIVSKWKINFSALFSKRVVLQSLLFLTGPIAFLLYCAYQKHMTGYYFAFSIAQAGWYKEFMFPLLSLFRRSDFTSQFNSIYTIVVIIIAFLSWKKLPLSLNIFIWINILLPLCSGSTISMQRYIAIIFPLTIIVSLWFYDMKYRYFMLGILFSLQLFVFYYWLTWSPFSY